MTMDETKREINNKTKRSKSENVKNIVQSYLQRRNYSTINLQTSPTTISQHITFSMMESEISRPNSILYSCYNNDPIVIDHNFSKFLVWLKDLVKNKNMCHDLEQLVAPLFCHLYLDILKGGHAERAATFFKAHLPSIDKTKCDDFVKDLINLFATDSDATCLKEQYRSNKYRLELTPQSLTLLKKFVVENCHVVFLHIFQSWFDLHEVDEEKIDETGIESKAIAEVIKPSSNGVYLEEAHQKLLDAIQDVEKEPKQIFVMNISNANEAITCALIKRSCGLIVYNQYNIIHLRPLHPLDPILGIDDCKEIQFNNHSKNIYSLAISVDNTRLVSGSEDCNLSIYNLDEMVLSRNCSGHLGPIYCVAISSNSNFVASGSQDTTARLWGIDNGQCFRIFVGHTEAITCIDFHPNCLYLATGSTDRNVRLWSLDNGSPLRLYHGSKGVIYSIVFSPVGDNLACASDDKKIRLWDVLTAKVNQEIRYKSELITKMMWSDNGKQLCGGGIDGIVRIWDFETNDNNKNCEPIINCNTGGKIFNLEYCFETFACVTCD